MPTSSCVSDQLPQVVHNSKSRIWNHSQIRRVWNHPCNSAKTTCSFSSSEWSMCFNQPSANMGKVSNLHELWSEISDLLDSFTLVCYTSALGFEGVDTSTLNYQVTDTYLQKAALTLTFLQDWSQSDLIKEWIVSYLTLWLSNPGLTHLASAVPSIL